MSWEEQSGGEWTEHCAHLRPVAVCVHSSLIRTRRVSVSSASWRSLWGCPRAVIMIYVVSNQNLCLFLLVLGGILLTASHNPGGKYYSLLPTMSQPKHCTLNRCSSFFLYLLLPALSCRFFRCWVLSFSSGPPKWLSSLFITPIPTAGLLRCWWTRGWSMLHKEKVLFFLLVVLSPTIEHKKEITYQTRTVSTLIFFGFEKRGRMWGT